MAQIQFNGEKLHYIIRDCGDGSAALQLFADEAALDLYLEKLEERGDYELSEGGSYILQRHIDEAMTVADVEKEFDE